MEYPHKMYKGSKVVVAKTEAQHLKFKAAGYGHSPKSSGSAMLKNSIKKRAGY